MKSFFERLQQNIQFAPKQVIFRSEEYPQGCTYQQLDEESGRVCQYLKDRNIGKEDYVMILMPREVSAYISVIGVWKSGAAMILLEEDYSPERVNYIKTELNCKLVITNEIFDAMMQVDICQTYEIPALHDACYATYTSGSMGKPKGICHEFGKLDMFDYDYRHQLKPLEGEGRFAIVTPLSFGPSIRNVITSLLYGKCSYIVPGNIVKNPKKLLQYFNENKINETSVTCSFFRMNIFETKTMKNVFVHSEPCTGIFSENVHVINLYTLSEVGFPIYTFRLDRPYENTPLGYANENVKIEIINKEGKKTRPYEIGEILVEDLYSRGYIHGSQETEGAFSGAWFHTGDLGYVDENGVAFLTGRKDEMIKIHGNRIEPMEIETVVKKVLLVNTALAKGFIDSNRSFIAVYLLKDELSANDFLDTEGNLIFSAQEMKDKLRNCLPDYMIPSYYMVLEAYPQNENGKVLRKDLPEPMVEAYQKSDDLPQNDAEKYFCQLFEKVLGLNKVGAGDDFYEIGGDSLLSMRAVAACERFELTISDLYDGRTPEKISRMVSEKFENSHLQDQNEGALLKSQPLLPEQQAVFEAQMLFPDFILDNLTRCFKLKKEIDIEKFRNVVDIVLRHHPVFSSILVNEDGIGKLLYRPELFKKTEIKTISRMALEELFSHPCRPFQMEDHLLYRHAIYRCDDVLYFFLEIHHVITDGISLRMLFEEIENDYQHPEIPLPTDYFFLLLEKNAEKLKLNGHTSEEVREWYQINSFANRADNAVKADRSSLELLPSKFERKLKIEKEKIINSVIFKQYKGNVFFLTCFLKTMTQYNQCNKAFTFWEYCGREQKIDENAHGMLVKTMPMGLEFNTQTDNISAFEMVKEAVIRQISCDLPLATSITDDFMWTPFFIYQKDVLLSKGFNNIFEKEISLQSGCVAFEFHIIDNDDENSIRCLIKYSAGLYDFKSVERFWNLFERNVIISLDDACQQCMVK